MPDPHPPADPIREPLSFAELSRRVSHLLHDTDCLMAEIREAIRKTRATVEKCRRNHPDPRRPAHEPWADGSDSAASWSRARPARNRAE